MTTEIMPDHVLVKRVVGVFADAQWPVEISRLAMGLALMAARRGVVWGPPSPLRDVCARVAHLAPEWRAAYGAQLR